MTTRIRGARTTMPAGTIAGNAGTKAGPAKAIRIKDIIQGAAAAATSMISAHGSSSSSGSISAGFGFSSGGVLTDNEILGFGIWLTDMIFTTGDPDTEVVSEYPANASAVLNIQKWVGGVRTTVGTITFSASGTTGTVAWTSSPYTHPANTILELHAPSPADLTLAWITGIVNGAAA